MANRNLDYNSLTKKQQNCYKDAVIGFTPFHGINYIAHEEMIKAFDLMEELKQDRFLVGKEKGRAEKLWDAYYNHMWSRLSDEMRAFYVDYGNAIYSAVEPSLEFLAGAICEYVKSGKKRNESDMLYARCIVTRIMFVDSAMRFVSYFKEFEQRCGLNFAPTFAYADMTPLAKSLDYIVEKMRPRQRPDIWNNPACVNAYDRIMEILGDGKFFEGKSEEATNMNTVLGKQYIRDRLQEKYTIK